MRGYTMTHPVQFRGVVLPADVRQFSVVAVPSSDNVVQSLFCSPTVPCGVFYCLMSGRYPAVVAPVPWQMSFVEMAGYSCTPCRTVATRATVSGCLTQDRMCNCNTVTRDAITITPPAQGFTPIPRRNAMTASANLFAFSESPVARTRTGSTPEIPLSSDLHLPHLLQNCVLHDFSL